jgi:hypothetical protein
VQVQGSSQAQVIPFDFNLFVATSGAKVKIAAVASTGTALQVGAQLSQFCVVRL